MKTVRVCLKEKGYKIIVGSGIFGSFGKALKDLNLGKDAIVVTNPFIRKRWGTKLSGSLKAAGFSVNYEEVPDTEQSKSAAVCVRLVERIAAYGKSRQIFIVAFGGGVIGDLAGFAASIYKRGIPYLQVPTTLLAQVDSSIGGKVAVDLKIGKNLIGAFYQPRMVFSEINFLKSLSTENFRDGLAEVIKYGVISDAKLFEYIEKNLDLILDQDRAAVEFIVWRSSAIKARVVELDEYDRSEIRIVLNYGHTIGHAIETAGGYSKSYSHGKAISIGMVAANILAVELGLIAPAQAGRIENLLAKAGLPTRAAGLDPDKIYNAHLYDKKFVRGKNRFVLAAVIGHAAICEDVPVKLIRKSIDAVCKGG